MDFPTALKQVLDTKARITRTSWENQQKVVFDHKIARDLRISWGPEVDGTGEYPVSISYIPTHDDMRARDWEIVPPPKAEQTESEAA